MVRTDARGTRNYTRCELTLGCLILEGGGVWSRPEIRLNPLRGLVVQTFADQYLVFANVDHYRSFFSEPGVASSQCFPGINRRGMRCEYAIRIHSITLL